MSQSTNPNKKSIEKLIASKKKHKAQLSVSNLVQGVLDCNHKTLSETITLLESLNEVDYGIGQEVIQKLIPYSGNSIRIGITGVPGVGKSTFIESFGTYLTEQNLKVAVLAIDPSSKKSGGSILGDKTRMNKLSSNPNAFIRPTASSGSLGGVARRTRESVFVCEAAGFNVILIETVGVGQSEIAVHSMTDFFLLLMLAGAGDELQGIKRGIMEMADAIAISKADGQNVKKANLARQEYKNALHLFPPNSNNWIPKVETLSALNDHGVDKIWTIIQDFKKLTTKNQTFEQKRKKQQKYWMEQSFKEKILNQYYNHPKFQELLTQIEAQLDAEEITSFQGAEILYNKLK